MPNCAAKVLSLPRNLFWAIPKRAEYYTPRVKRTIQLFMKDATTELAQRIKTDGVDLSAARKASEDISKALRTNLESWAIGMGRDGWYIAEGIVRPSKRRQWEIEGKAGIPVARGFGSDAQVENVIRVNISDWIDDTSRSYASTVSGQIESIMKSAAVYQDSDGRGLTPVDIAKYFSEQFNTFTGAYSTLIARTTTNYAYNDGATLLYQDVGFSVGEWIVTDDDVLCPYCEQFDGKTFTLGEPVIQRGSAVSVEGERDYVAAFDIPHAPLHPHCRCTVGVSYSDPLFN